MPKDELWHYGVKGMKWGVRRFQNKDGTLTSAGKKKYQGTRWDIEKQIDPEDVDQWVGIQKEIEKKSGDWYNQIAVSKRFSERNIGAVPRLFIGDNKTNSLLDQIKNFCHCVLCSYGLLYDIHMAVKKDYWILAEEWICNFPYDYGLEVQQISIDSLEENTKI